MQRSCDLELVLSSWPSISSSEKKMQLKPADSQGSCEDPKGNVYGSAWYTLITATLQ